MEKVKDTIYRQDAIDALTEYGNGRTVYIGVEEAVRRIEQLSSVTPEPRWIPCSERLPENGEQVLVYARSAHYALAKYDEIREANGTYKKQWVTFDAWKPFYTIKEVIAWMLLPEPYGQKDGKNELRFENRRQG